MRKNSLKLFIFFSLIILVSCNSQRSSSELAYLETKNISISDETKKEIIDRKIYALSGLSNKELLKEILSIPGVVAEKDYLTSGIKENSRINEEDFLNLNINEEIKYSLDLWYIEILDVKYKNWFGDFTGKCLSIMLDKNYKILRYFHWK